MEVLCSGYQSSLRSTTARVYSHITEHSQCRGICRVNTKRKIEQLKGENLNLIGEGIRIWRLQRSGRFTTRHVVVREKHTDPDLTSVSINQTTAKNRFEYIYLVQMMKQI